MKTFAAFAFALVGTVAAIAQPQMDPATTTVSPATPVVTEGGPPVVAPQIANGFEYLNGGSDIDTANYLKTRGGEYPLQVLITGRGGQWAVADSLTLRGRDGTNMTIPNAGPYVLVKLPPGTYSAEATFGGVVETRQLTVGRGVSKVSWNTARVGG